MGSLIDPRDIGVYRAFSFRLSVGTADRRSNIMGLQDNIYTDTVADLSVRQLVKIKPSDTVQQACELMKEARLGAAVAVDEAGHPIGMFNEKLLIRLLATQPDALNTPVSEHMTTNVVTVKTSDSIAKLINIMREHQYRWVCVVDEQGKAVSLTGLRGVMEFVVDHFPRVVKGHPIDSKLSIEEREGA